MSLYFSAPQDMMRCDAFGLFLPAALIAELRVLDKHFADAPALSKPPDDEEWAAIIQNFTHRLGPHYESDTARAARGTLADHEAAAARAQIQAAQRACQAVQRRHEPTGLLLPVAYGRRLEWLLGYGRLPMAWINFLDVCAFRSP